MITTKKTEIFIEYSPLNKCMILGGAKRNNNLNY